MVFFEGFRAVDGVPIYLQIQTYIRRGCVAGTIQNGDELPSRRVLSALLGVNPNTVQKAYRLLEETGLMRSHPGAKSVMVLEDGAMERIRAQLLAEDARSAVQSLRSLGLTLDQAHALLDRYWNEVKE